MISEQFELEFFCGHEQLKVIGGWATTRRNDSRLFMYKRLECKACSHRWSEWILKQQEAIEDELPKVG